MTLAPYRLFQRVVQAQSRKTCEVTVRRVENAAVLHRQSCQLRVSYNRTPGLTVEHHLTQENPMLITRRQQTNVGLLYPLVHNFGRFLRREPLSGKSLVRYNPEEGGNRLPRQPDRYPARKDLLNPSTGFRVTLRAEVIRV